MTDARQHNYKGIKATGGWMVCLAMIILSGPAFAQGAIAAPGIYPMPDNEEMWRDHYAERRDIREQREELRHQHDTLEAEHDGLRSECMDAKGQERSECHAKWVDYRQRKEALIARARALRDHAATDGQHMRMMPPPTPSTMPQN